MRPGRRKLSSSTRPKSRQGGSGHRQLYWGPNALADVFRKLPAVFPVPIVLVAQAWPPLPTMDLVLLRNVVIYFEVAMKKSDPGSGGAVAAAGRLPALGRAETTFNIDESFRRVEQVKAGCYQLVR